jgi:hypothetical protein
MTEENVPGSKYVIIIIIIDTAAGPYVLDSRLASLLPGGHAVCNVRDCRSTAVGPRTVTQSEPAVGVIERQTKHTRPTVAS